MVLEYLRDGLDTRERIREGELMVPAFTPHSPHRPPNSWGLAVEVKRRPEETESLLWLCERCDASFTR